MSGQYVIQAIFALVGLLSLLAALLNWDWFFNTRSAQSILRRSRREMRLFYGLLGVIFIGAAVLFFVMTAGLNH